MISVIIPAYREADRIGATLNGVRCGGLSLSEPFEIIVVDDGSDDGTAEKVQPQEQGEGKVPSVHLLRLERNRGKGVAVAHGLAAARGELIVLLDGDLGGTAAEFPRLVRPIQAGEADMTIAQLPRCRGGGLGLALRAARWGVACLTGRVLAAPLSGQRAFRTSHLALFTPLEPGFGLEVGIDVDALWGGLRLLEVPTAMAHAATGRDWAGFRHRGRQLVHIVRALWKRTWKRKSGQLR